jgi:hypothetical protein
VRLFVFIFSNPADFLELELDVTNFQHCDSMTTAKDYEAGHYYAMPASSTALMRIEKSSLPFWCLNTEQLTPEQKLKKPAPASEMLFNDYKMHC